MLHRCTPATSLKTMCLRSSSKSTKFSRYSPLTKRSELQDTICWNAKDDGFIIKNPTKLENEVLPHYFKHNKVQSLVRQLNMYDFHKIRTKAKEKEFKHEYFKRAKPELLCFIRRKLGEENSYSTSKADVLLQKCKDLEERVKTFESMAKLSIPVKKLKVLEQQDCKLLFDGLMSYLDCTPSTNTALVQATSEYLERLRGLQSEETGRKSTRNLGEKTQFPHEEPKIQVDQLSYLSKREPLTEETESNSDDYLQLTYVDERSTCNSLESLEFNMDLLDFEGLYKETINPFQASDFCNRAFF